MSLTSIRLERAQADLRQHLKRVWNRGTLFTTACSVLSRFGGCSLVHDTRVGIVTVRFLYSFMCGACSGRKQQVHSIEDFSVAGAFGRMKLRIYRGSARAVQPAVIFFHGGAFCVGNLESHDASLRALASAASCMVIVVDYRLAPEHPFPAGINDAYTALEWIGKNAQRLGIDSEKLVVAGDSAGGALAAVVARWARDRGSPKIALQLLIYPMTDAAMSTASWKQFRSGPGINAAVVKAAWSRYCPDLHMRLSEDVSPLAAKDLRNLPPAVVITAENDPLRDEGEMYAAALQAQKVPVSVRRYAGAIHGFFQIPDSPEGRQVIKDIARILQDVRSPASIQ